MIKLTKVINPVILTKPKKDQSYGMILIGCFINYKHKEEEGTGGDIIHVYPDGHSEIYRPTKNGLWKQVRYDTTPIEIDRLVMQAGREVSEDEWIYSGL